MGDGGKGSAQRPVANRKQFEENWDAIFGVGGNNADNAVGRVDDGAQVRDCGGAQHSSEDKPSE